MAFRAGPQWVLRTRAEGHWSRLCLTPDRAGDVSFETSSRRSDPLKTRQPANDNVSGKGRQEPIGSLELPSLHLLQSVDKTAL